MNAPVNHVNNAKEFVADRERMKRHDRTLWAVRKKRDEVSGEIPEWERLRELAAQIKAHTISNLADLLEQFETKAIALGAEVHWASTPDDLNRAVLKILRENEATRIVKSKSMLTEECGLNPYLLDHGLEIVDVF